MHHSASRVLIRMGHSCPMPPVAGLRARSTRLSFVLLVVPAVLSACGGPVRHSVPTVSHAPSSSLQGGRTAVPGTSTSKAPAGDGGSSGKLVGSTPTSIAKSVVGHPPSGTVAAGAPGAVPAIATSIFAESGSSPSYQVHVAYPRLEGLPSQAAQASINGQLRSAVANAVSSFVENVTALGSPGVGQGGPGFAGPGAAGGTGSGSGSGPSSTLDGSFTTTLLDRSVASFSIRGLGEVAGAAQPSTIVVNRTFDLSDGATYSLSDMFRPGADYPAVLSRLSTAALQARFGAGNWTAVAGPSASNFATWGLSPTGLQLTFPNAPQALAAPTITLPYAALASIASSRLNLG